MESSLSAVAFLLAFSLAAPIASQSVIKIGRKSYEAQLYEDLLFYYNKIARPVKNSTDVLHIDVGASLIRIIDVDEKNQVLTTNLWLEMRWNDSRLQWDPERYGGIRQLHIPSTDIWIPDFVLYDNAAGDPDITIFTDALVSFNGRVYWQPPAIYKSFCPIKVKWFPYDKQDCRMKFGAWSYTGNYVDLHLIRHDLDSPGQQWEGGSGQGEEEYMEMGMDLSFFYKSNEWDLMNLTSERHAVLYTSCCGPETYVDITYYLELRRKTLFFTCNLIIPCFLISFLTTFVFYLSDHKITFSISILVTLTVFFLVLIDLMPPTSLEVPMFGQYLITTMILVALSTMVSVVTVNIRFRNGATHQMSPWIRIVFLHLLPKLLFMKRPERAPKSELPDLQGSLPGSLASPVGFGTSPSALATICPSLMHSQPRLVNKKAPPKEEDHFGLGQMEMLEASGRRPRPNRLFAHNNVSHHGSPASLQMAGSSLSLPHTAMVKPHVRPPPPYSAKGTSEAMTKQCQMCSPNSLAIKRSPPMAGTMIGNGRFEPGSGQSQQQKVWVERGSQSGITLRDGKKRANEIIFGNLVKQVRFIAEYFRRCEEEAEISDDWTFVAMVLDRLFLLIFSILNMGTFSIIISAPTLFDFRQPLNETVPTRPLGQANLFSVHHE